MSGLTEIFNFHGVRLYAAASTQKLRVTRPYLLERAGMTDFTYAIFAAVPYLARESTQAGATLAAFACVRDYHAYFASLFDDVSTYIEKKYASRVCGFADHSPFDEVYCSALCALGVIGENGLLITKQHSSFVVIGEIVTTLDRDMLIAEGIPVSDLDAPLHCERCGKCADACPTHAIDCGDKSICASAVSQKKGVLSDADALRIEKSPYVWGCDVCQNVCPHTADALLAGTLYTDIPYFTEAVIPSLSENEVYAMTDTEWASRAYSWRERDVMLRNIKLKNTSDNTDKTAEVQND